MKTIIVVAMSLASAAALLGSEPPAPSFERVRSKYPSRAQLQARVDQFKATHAAEFATARADFDLGIRSMLSLEFPKRPARDEKHSGPKKDPLPAFFNRETILNQITKCDEVPGYSEWKTFYQQHIDEISVDETAALRVVCLDVLLNGWSDWSNWQTPKLHQARDSFPDLHLEYALRCIDFVKTPEDYELTRPAVSVALDVMLDRSKREAIRQSAAGLIREVCSIGKDTDLLRFSIDAAVRSPDKETRLMFLSIAGRISGDLGELDRREFWLAYLNDSDEWIRTMAISGVVESIRKPRPGEPPRPRDAELAQLLRNIAENDSSPRVRQFLQPRLEQYERSDTKPMRRGGRINEPPHALP